jgi:hypothetical protein
MIAARAGSTRVKAARFDFSMKSTGTIYRRQVDGASRVAAG